MNNDHHLLFFLALILSIFVNSASAQWTHIEAPFSVSDFVYHEPTGFILATPSQENQGQKESETLPNNNFKSIVNDDELYEFRNGSWSNITPNGNITEIDLSNNVTSDGHLYFTITIDDIEKLYVYNGSSLLALESPNDVRDFEVGRDYDGRLYHFDETSGDFWVYENHTWQSINVPGDWNGGYWFEYESDSDSDVFTSPDGSIPLIFDDNNGGDFFYFYKDGMLTPISFPWPNVSTNSDFLDGSGGIYFAAEYADRKQKLYHFINGQLSQRSIPTFKFLSVRHVTIEHDVIGVVDTLDNEHIWKLGITDIDITPASDHKSYEFSGSNTSSEEITLISQDMSNDYHIWESSSGLTTWNDITPTPVDGSLATLHSFNDGDLVVREDAGSNDYIHVYKDSNWEPRLLISNRNGQGLKEYSSKDLIIIKMSHISRFEQDTFYLYDRSSWTNISSDIPIEAKELDFIVRYDSGEILFENKNSSDLIDIFNYRNGVNQNITPAGNWESSRLIDEKYIRLTDEPTNDKHLFDYRDDELVRISDENGDINFKAEEDENERYYFSQDGDDSVPKLVEYDGQNIYDLGYVHEDINTLNIRFFSESQQLLFFNISKGMNSELWTYTIGNDQYEPCAHDILIPHHQPLDVTNYEAAVSIFSSEYIDELTPVIFEAPDFIELMPGFSIETSSELSMIISGACDD